MAEWNACLKADPTAWLLEDENPSVRYLTLTNILDRKQSNPDVKRAKADIMRTGAVPRILAKQSDGMWGSPGRFYADKYKGSVWQLIVLAEHEADGRNEMVRAGCEYVLGCSQDPESYGFAHKAKASGGGLHSEVIPCLTGNMIWSLVKLGYFGDSRVGKGIDWIVRYQRFDDGTANGPTGWPYDRYKMCWGTHSCHMGVIKSLKALSAIPKSKKDKRIENTILKASDYVLAHHIYKQSHELSKTSKPGWLKLQFPLMYQTDILEIAGILLELGIKDGRMGEAIEKIVSKQNDKGQWNLESTFNGRFQVNIERKDKPSKWLTYRAMRVLKKYYE